MFHISSSIFLGWALGSNDAANIFGTAVASRIIRYRTAIILAAIFVLLGAIMGGSKGIRVIGGLASQDLTSAFIISLAAGLTVTVMSILKLPVSTSQAVVGSIMGLSLFRDPSAIDWPVLIKIVICWMSTPLGAALIAFLLYPLLAFILDIFKFNIITRSTILRAGLIISGSYGAYALGANNVANVTGVFYGTGLFNNNTLILSLIGGASIALGVLTFSKNVMTTVGSRLVQLDAFSALIAVLALAITVHVYALIGVPVSTSQAIVGGVLGVGLFKGVKTINRKTLINIFFGWFSTPLIAGLVSFCLNRIILQIF